MLNVAIDGPGGAGKSTIARKAAQKEGLHYVDTGALYRAVGYVLTQQGVDLASEEAVAKAITGLKVRLSYTEKGQRVFVSGKDVTPYLRTLSAGDGASKVGVHGCVRDMLLDIQRQTAREYDVIMDGRDIGTVVLPQADVKFYITASLEERSRRRLHELEEAGKPHGTLEEITKEIRERDYRDTHRAIAPLKKADDAIYLDTTKMTIDQAVAKVCQIIEETRNSKA